MPLRVLHLSTYAEGGGAARAAANVNSALQRAGVDSRIMTAHGNRFKCARAADRALWRLQRSPLKTWRSPARFGSLSAASINESPADVVNLHWVTDGFLSVEEIGKVNKPVVMTMYDQWPICGTEHYAANSPDPRWRDGYLTGNRPSGEIGVDLDRLTWRRKMRHWNGFHMIPASSWLESVTRSSALCSDWPITRIAHASDEFIFKPIHVDIARRMMGLLLDVPTIGFISSAGIGDRRKGFDLLSQALKDICETIGSIHVVIAGPRPKIHSLPRGASVSFIGQISSDAELATFYSALDVLAVPSRQDNLPLTAIEAQLTGTPVVAFKVGGLPDILNSCTNGYLASPFDVADFARGLGKFLGDRSLTHNQREDSRKDSVQRFGFKSVADQYMNIYTTRFS